MDVDIEVILGRKQSSYALPFWATIASQYLHMILEIPYKLCSRAMMSKSPPTEFLAMANHWPLVPFSQTSRIGIRRSTAFTLQQSELMVLISLTEDF